MKVHGSNEVTVRNRASLRKILPVVPVHSLVCVQGKNPVQEAQGAESAGSRLDRAGQQAGPQGFVDRAGLRAGVKSGDNVDISGRQAGSRAGDGPRVQSDADSAEAVLRAGAEVANPGILGVLRSMPRLKAGADSVLGAGQSRGGADPGYSRVLGPEGGPAAAATGTSGLGGSRQLLDSRDRSGLSHPPLGSSSPVQGDVEGVHRDQVGQTQAEVLVPVQTADCPCQPPTVRQGTRIKHPTYFYQAGLD